MTYSRSAYFLLPLVIACAFAIPSWAADGGDQANGAQIQIIDTHAHPVRTGKGNREDRISGSISHVLSAMQEQGIQMTIFLPPPRPESTAFDLEEYAPLAKNESHRIVFGAGGGSLNVMIQNTSPDKVTPEIISKFREKAEKIAGSGAVVFGEFAAEHFSRGKGSHPYMSVTPDHPLFMELADIAAKHDIHIDFHMEAVPYDMPFPGKKAPLNPEEVHENIKAFERLLDHNPKARIAWAHAGWDWTGGRTPALMEELLARHPNLYMSIKLDPHGGHRKTWPFLPDGSIKPEWIDMLRKFPDRFMIGSDQFYDEDDDHLVDARHFIDLLPPDIARAVARDNAIKFYHLKL